MFYWWKKFMFCEFLLFDIVYIYLTKKITLYFKICLSQHITQSYSKLAINRDSINYIPPSQRLNLTLCVLVNLCNFY
jgi:hypothetical protein